MWTIWDAPSDRDYYGQQYGTVGDPGEDPDNIGPDVEPEYAPLPDGELDFASSGCASARVRMRNLQPPAGSGRGFPQRSRGQYSPAKFEGLKR